MLGLATRLFQARGNPHFSVVAFGRDNGSGKLSCYLRASQIDLFGGRQTVAVAVKEKEVKYTEPVSEILGVSVRKVTFLRIGY